MLKARSQDSYNLNVDRMEIDSAFSLRGIDISSFGCDQQIINCGSWIGF